MAIVSPQWAQGTADNTPVTSIRDLATKYGSRSIPLVVQEFVSRCPEFSGSHDLAIALGTMMADLEAAIKGWQEENRR